jgi:hypothetical protein
MKILLIILIIHNTFYAKSYTKAELYKKAFGIVPDKSYELKLYINNKNTQTIIKMISKKLETDYIYNLDELNKYLIKPIKIRKILEVKNIPYKYDLYKKRSIINIHIPQKKLNPWNINIKGKDIKNDTFTNDFYYHIPLNINYKNNMKNISTGLNIYNGDTYLQATEKNIEIGHKNVSIGDLTTTIYGDITTEKTKGIKYNSKSKKEISTKNNFSNVIIENRSIVEVWKNKRKIKRMILNPGKYNFSNIDNLHLHYIKIINLENNEKTYIKNKINKLELFNYDITKSSEGVSCGVEYSLPLKDEIITTEIGYTNLKDIKEIGLVIKTENIKAKISKKKKEDITTKKAELKINDIRIRYSEAEENKYDIFNNEIEIDLDKKVSIAYNKNEYQIEAKRNLTTNENSYKLTYTDNYKDLFYKITLKKDEKEYIGIALNIPLWKHRNNNIKLHHDTEKNETYSTGYAYYKNNEINFKYTKKRTEIFNSYKNNYSNIKMRYIKDVNRKAEHSLYFNTNIIGSKTNLTISDEIPKLNESVWFIKNEDNYLKDIYIADEDKQYEFNESSLDFETTIKNNTFNLEYKKNRSGDIVTEKEQNIMCEPNWGRTPLELFIYEKDGISKTSFISMKNKIFLNDIEDGIYTIRFKDVTHTIEIKNDNCIAN